MEDLDLLQEKVRISDEFQRMRERGSPEEGTVHI